MTRAVSLSRQIVKLVDVDTEHFEEARIIFNLDSEVDFIAENIANRFTNAYHRHKPTILARSYLGDVAEEIGSLDVRMTIGGHEIQQIEHIPVIKKTAEYLDGVIGGNTMRKYSLEIDTTNGSSVIKFKCYPPKLYF